MLVGMRETKEWGKGETGVRPYAEAEVRGLRRATGTVTTEVWQANPGTDGAVLINQTKRLAASGGGK